MDDVYGNGQNNIVNNTEGHMSTDQLLALSNEALLAKATEGKVVLSTPQYIRDAYAQLAQEENKRKMEEENSNADYLVAGETAKRPEQAHKLEVTPQAVAAFQNAGIDAAVLQANINMMRMDGVPEEEIKNRFWAKAKQLDPSLLTPEEDEAKAETEFYQLSDYFNNVLHHEIPPFGKGTPYRYMVSRMQAMVPQIEAHNAYVAREYEVNRRGKLGATRTALVDDSLLGFNSYLLDNNELEIRKMQGQVYPAYSGVGHFAAFAIPYTGEGALWKTGLNISKNLLKESAPFWKATLGAAIRGGAVTVGQTTTEFNKGMATALNDSDTERALQAIYSLPGKLLENYAGALGGEVVGGVAYAIGAPVRSAFTTQRTTDELFSLQGRKDILANIKREMGTDVAALELIKGIEEGNVQTIQKIISTNPKLAQTVAANSQKWVEITRGKINAATTPLHKQISYELLQGAKMPQRAQQIAEGKPISFNTSEEGLMAIIGEHADETSMAYADALARGQGKMGSVNARQNILRLFNNPGDVEAPGLLNAANDKEMKAFTDQITGVTFPGFYKSSPELVKAEAEIAKNIAKLRQGAANNPSFTPEKIAAMEKQIRADAYLKGPREYFDRIMNQTGTDDIYDIDALKKMVDKGVKAKEIAGGEGTAFGRFRKRLNTEILDQADPMLAEIHNIDKVKGSVSDAYQFGKKLTPGTVTEIDDYLIKDGIKMKPVRLAATKMALLDSYRTAAIKGDAKAVKDIQDIIQSSVMKKYMNSGEWKGIVEAVRPEIKATEYIAGFSAAATKQTKTSLTDSFAKLGLDTMLNRQAAAINEVFMTMGRAKYNAGVARKLQDWLTNPEKNWTQFNKIIESTHDFAERQMLSQIIGQATQMTLTTGD